MKKLITIALTLIALTNVANAQQSLISVSEMLQNPSTKPVTIYLRCTALLGSVSGVLEQANYSDKDLIDNGFKAAEILMSYATGIYQGEYYLLDKSFIEDKVVDVSLEIAELYLHDMYSNYQTTGEYVLGTYVQEDMGICIDVYNNSLKNFS